MASRRDIVAGGAAVEIKAIDSATKVVRQVTDSFAAAGRTIAATGGAMVAAAAGAAAGIALLTVSMSNKVDVIDKAAKRTGVSAEALQGLGHGAGLSGATFDDIAAGLRNMNKFLASNQAPDALAAIGVSLDSLAGKSPDEQMLVLADALRAISDPAQQTAAAMEIFGKSGSTLLPFLQEGSVGIRRMAAEAQSLGLIVKGDTVAAFAAYNDATGRLSATIGAISTQLAASFLPILQPIVDSVTQVTSAVAQWLAENQQIGGIIAATIGIVGALGAGLVALGGILAIPASLFASVATVVAAFTTVMGAAAAPVAAVALGIGLILGTLTALAAAWALNTFAAADFDSTVSTANESLGGLWKWINETYQSLVAKFGPAIEGVITALKDGDFYSAGKLAFLGLQLAASEIMQWLVGFARQRMTEVATIIIDKLKVILGLIPGMTSRLDAELAKINTINAAADAGYEAQQQKITEQIDALKREVDARHAAKEAEEEAARVAEELAAEEERKRSAEFAMQMQESMKQQDQSGYEPGGDKTATIGTAAAGVAGQVVAPMQGIMQPITTKLDQQIEIQRQIADNTAVGQAFGA